MSSTPGIAHLWELLGTHPFCIVLDAECSRAVLLGLRTYARQKRRRMREKSDDGTRKEWRTGPVSSGARPFLRHSVREFQSSRTAVCVCVQQERRSSRLSLSPRRVRPPGVESPCAISWPPRVFTVPVCSSN